MRKPALLLALGLSASFAGTALAQPAPGAYPPPGAPYGAPPGAMTAPPGGPQQGQAPHGLAGKFESANVTHDGRLTEAQAEQSGWKSVAKHFAEIDRDNKGYVTEQDIKAWHHERHAEKAAMHQQAPQGGPPPGAGGPPPGAPPPGSQPY